MVETLEQFRARMMEADTGTLVKVMVYLGMAFSEKEYNEKVQKLEVLKQVVTERGLA